MRKVMKNLIKPVKSYNQEIMCNRNYKIEKIYKEYNNSEIIKKICRWKITTILPKLIINKYKTQVVTITPSIVYLGKKASIMSSKPVYNKWRQII